MAVKFFKVLLKGFGVISWRFKRPHRNLTETPRIWHLNLEEIYSLLLNVVQGLVA